MMTFLFAFIGAMIGGYLGYSLFENKKDILSDYQYKNNGHLGENE